MTYSPPSDPLLQFQYYIDSAALEGATVDINLGDIWQDYTGAGIRVGIYDQAIEESHPDLDDNYDATLESEEDVDTAPHERESHGTPVAGIIAAERNGEGTVGIAYDATIAGVRLFNEYGWLGEYRLVRAMQELTKYDVTNHSWTYNSEFVMAPGDNTYPGAAFRQAVGDAAALGREGLGTIIVTAAGNNRADASSPDLQPLAAMRQAIVVGATDYNGWVTSYSEEGATVFVVAPSSPTLSANEVVATTDLLGAAGYDGGDWTLGFGGTSAASPMVAAVTALMLDANPELGWRDVQEILALTARHTGSAIGAGTAGGERPAWMVNDGAGANGGGYHVSRDYGFGLIDAHAAVRLAETWTEQRTSANEVSQTVAVESPPQRILDAGADGLVYTFDMAPGIDVEHIALDIRVTSSTPSGIVIEVISPAGTVEEVISGYGRYASSFGRWIFGANAFRGEESAGTWTVRVRNIGQDTSATARDLTLTLYGAPHSDDDTLVYTDEFGALNLAGSDTLHDSAGHDVLNGAALTGAAVIALTPGAQSVIAGRTLTIAPDSWIEDATGGDGGDRITGNALGNLLRGMRGNDTLDGGDGTDTLEGGLGDDTYVEPGTDTIVELPGGGTDTVVSRAGYSLAVLPAVENITLIGRGDVNANGNAARNVLSGNAGDNRLAGGGGDDRLIGGAGDDTLNGGADSDTASYSATRQGIDADLTLGTASGAEIGHDTLIRIENLTGGAGRDRLTGDGGANRLDGRGAADLLRGGDGDDTYVVDDAGDRIVERAGEGIDLVRSALGFSLVDTQLESLTLTGSAAIDATGNRFDNRLTGNAGANRLEGRDGADALSGGAGNDTLTGGTGDDRMAGGAGADVFRFAAAPGSAGRDVIRDFEIVLDRFDLSGGAFASFSETAAGTRLFHTGGTVLVQGVTGLTLDDWNALVLPPPSAHALDTAPAFASGGDWLLGV